MTSLVERENQNLVSLWESLQASGAITDTELRLPPDISYDSYEALAMMLGRVKRSTSWLIGDLILYGEVVYGETYAQAVALTGLAPSTCANYASVCRYIPPSRRRVGISFSLHQEVAYLEPQQQNEWLDRAEQLGWTKAQLRHELQSSGLMGHLAVSGKTDEIRHESHPAEHHQVPAAVVRDFLGEPESDPISIVAKISAALQWIPLSDRGIVIDHLMPNIRNEILKFVPDY